MIPLQLPQISSRHFCGREAELLAIRTSLSEQEAKSHAQRVVVIHGLGGVGKTQLCLSYVLHNKSSYKAAFWINASSDRTICDHFRQIAQALVDWAAQIRAAALNFSRIAFDLGLGQAVSPTTGEVSAHYPRR
jgi:Cdc6-like AAA superfamily ATPase